MIEILLLVAIVAAGGSALYVAATFNRRTELNTAPLIKAAVKDISRAIDAAQASSASQYQEVSGGLARHEQTMKLEGGEVRARLSSDISQISNMASQLKMKLDAVERLADRIGSRQEGVSRTLEQLTDQVGKLSESLGQQGMKVAQIDNLVRNSEALAAEIGSIHGPLRDISARQSRADDQLAAVTRSLDGHMESASRREHYERWASGYVMDAAERIEAILRGQSDIQSYLQSLLDYEVARTSQDRTCRIVAAGVHLSGPGTDIISALLLSFCEVMGLKTLIPWSPYSQGRPLYLLWRPPGGRSLDDVLGAKMAACPGGSWISPGLKELRSLSLALHATGSGTIRLGPMIINRTQTALLGCVTTAAEAANIDAADAMMTPDACEQELRQLGYGRVTELTAWADTFVS